MIDQGVFVEPREIKLNLPEGGKIDFFTRSLRASTAQGERIALAASERIPPGTWFEVEVLCMNKDNLNWVRNWLAYGRLNGLLQWRNAGYGQFAWEEL